MKSNADALKDQLVAKFETGLSEIRNFADSEIRPVIKEEFDAITDNFYTQLDDAQEGFGKVLI